MAFLKTILIILLVYYLFKILIKLFAPKILGYAGKKAEQHFREKFEGFNTQQSPQNNTKQGDVIIDDNTIKKSNSSKKVGEYIDFEEID
ncbi:DUF4834 family protein [Cellulophaga sp. E16_2]|uniref:DUF4834 domain-containing protein n=1 Tax=Cellulophaga algicola (strain DSM 14237 / IC166 / ACAM 630) TaxID=688270 RepID=E6X7J7_CELAD|nr:MULTISPECIES: DUF4834 family protein [Cellulophaga]ADV50707.1 hypothetical protein Celal_3442 [Cellulophaga algicola DSM 14237]MBO0593091.1 DUF4834 family protein [Cellulophaga sp. E16_2]